MTRLEKAKAAIRRWLEKEGYEFGIFGGSLNTHFQGILGNDWVLVNPQESERGARTIAVSPKGVIDYEILSPFIENKWRMVAGYPYSTKEELKNILNKLCEDKDYGVWEEDIS